MTEQGARLSAKLTREMGPLVLQALADPDVTEIALNPDGALWEDRLGAGMRRVGSMSPAQAELMISTIAASLGQAVSRAQPVLEGELPLDGSRFEGLLPPVCAAPVFSIRKRASRVFTLDEHLAMGTIGPALRRRLREAVAARANILIAGGAGSGKTTFANALLHEIAVVSPDHRLAVIEDTPELQCAATNLVALRAAPGVGMNDLLRASLRLRPDRIIVGETRGPEALALLKAWNTGHPGGLATLHADSAARAIDRLEQLLLEATSAPLRPLIAEAVQIILFLERGPAGRRVAEALAVSPEAGGRLRLQPLDACFSS